MHVESCSDEADEEARPTSSSSAISVALHSSSLSASSSSTATSHSAYEQLLQDLADVRRRLNTKDEQLTNIDKELNETKQRRNALRARGDPEWQREDRELGRLTDEKKLLLATQQQLLATQQQLMQRQERLEEHRRQERLEEHRRQELVRQREQATLDVGTYDPGAWPPGAGLFGGAPFDLFDSSMRPALLPRGALNQLLVEAERDQFNAAAWHTSDAHGRYNGTFLASLLLFFARRRSTETTEATDHARNDCLLDILCASSGLDLRLLRDSVTASTSDLSRPDAHLGLVNLPPYVLIEEKAASVQLGAAREDLRQKFRWIMHYGNRPFVFAIAIAGNLIEFGALNARGVYAPFPGPGGRGGACFDTSQNGSVAGALHCVHAAINIGRYIRFLHQHCPPEALGVAQFNTSIERRRVDCTKTLRITFEHVVKRYHGGISAEDVQRMVQFYEGTARVPCLEKAVTVSSSATDVTFRLTPVGVPRVPRLNDPDDIRRCLKDVLTALRGAHEAGWVLVDVRAPNMIYAHDVDTNTNRFFLIDACEFARRKDTPLPIGVVRTPRGWPGAPNTADAKWDLLMLAEIFAHGEYAGALNALPPHGADFRKCLAAGGTSAADLLNHPFLEDVRP